MSENDFLNHENEDNLTFSKSFQAKLILSSEEIKDFYNKIKNHLLSYKKIKTRLSWKKESFKIGRKTIAGLTFHGKTLCLCLSLNAFDYQNTKYKGIEDLNGVNGYSDTPSLYRIKNKKRLLYSLELIDEVMHKFNIEKNLKYEEQDFKPPYAEIDFLLEQGLVKKVDLSFKKNNQSNEIVDLSVNQIELEDKGDIKVKESEVSSKHLEKYNKRIGLENILKALIAGFLVAFIVAAILNLILKPIFDLLHFPYRNIIVSSAALITWIVAFIIFLKKVFKTRDMLIARRVDSLGLDDRVVTMVQFKDDDSLIAKLQRKDAGEKLETVEPKMVKMKFPKILIIGAVVALFLGSGTFFIPEAVVKAQPNPTAYKVRFYSNGGKFSFTYLNKYSYMFNDAVQYDEFVPTKYLPSNDKDLYDPLNLDSNGNWFDTYYYVELDSQANTSENKLVENDKFANNQGIKREGYALVGWNFATLDNDGKPITTNSLTGLEIKDTIYYMEGLNIKKDTSFFAIWMLYDEIISQMLNELRAMVNEADVDNELKNDLLKLIDDFEKEITSSNMTNQEKLERTKAFQQEILDRLKKALEQIVENNQSAGDVLITWGEKIPSPSFVEMGNGIKEGKYDVVSDGLDKILDETSTLSGQELVDKLSQYIEGLREAAQAAYDDGNIRLGATLDALADALEQAKDSATNDNNEQAKEEIKDAIDHAKENFKDIFSASNTLGEITDNTSDVIQEAIDKLEGQTGNPSDNEDIKPNNPQDPNKPGDVNSSSNSGTNSNNSGTSSGSNSNNSGTNSGSNSNNSGNSGSNSGLTSGSNSNSGSNSGNSGSGSNSGSNSKPNSGNSGSNSGSNTSNNSQGNGNNPGNPDGSTDKDEEYVIDGNTTIGDALDNGDYYGDNGVLGDEYSEFEDLIKDYLDGIR